MSVSTNSTESMANPPVTEKQGHRSGRLAAGIALVIVGLFTLVAQFAPGSDLDLYLVLGLGIVFLAWGIFVRNAGPIIPGCILSGIGLGIVLEKTIGLPNTGANGGLMLLSMALGFAAITPLTAVFAKSRHI